MVIELKVLTLNCWGVFVPFACTKRKERLKEIGKTLGQGIYDVACLQEIWCQTDYQDLCNVLCPAMPYAHYFHAGIIGSGLCIFSKHKILETSQHHFSLNGYAHKIFCGDWMGSKSVGLTKLMIQPLGIRVNVYNTHLHAQYSPEKTFNSFDEHRCLQSFEMSKFIKDTSSCCDVVIVGGDFNTSPNQIGYQLIRSIGNLEDSWKTQKDKVRSEVEEPTCERPDNRLGPINTHCPEGVRLDYLLHRQNSGFKVVCESCNLAMRKIPGSDLPYSDHEGVEAIYKIEKVSQAEEVKTTLKTKDKFDETVRYLEEGISVLGDGIKKARSGQKFWLLIAILLGSLLVMILEKQKLQATSHEVQSCLLSQQTKNLKFESHVKDLVDDQQYDKARQPESVNKDIESYCSQNGGDYRNLRFYIPEIMKIIIVSIILFSLLHGLIVLTWEIVTFKSRMEDMRWLAKYPKMSSEGQVSPV